MFRILTLALVLLLPLMCYAQDSDMDKKSFLEDLAFGFQQHPILSKEEKEELKRYIKNVDPISNESFLKEYGALLTEINRDGSNVKTSIISFYKMYMLVYRFLSSNEHQYDKIAVYQEGFSFYFTYCVYMMVDYEDAIQFSSQDVKYTFVESCLFSQISFLAMVRPNKMGLSDWFVLDDMMMKLKEIDSKKFEEQTKEKLKQQLKGIELLSEQIAYFYFTKFSDTVKNLDAFAILSSENYSANFVTGEQKGILGLIKFKEYRVDQLKKTFSNLETLKENEPSKK